MLPLAGGGLRARLQPPVISRGFGRGAVETRMNGFAAPHGRSRQMNRPPCVRGTGVAQRAAVRPSAPSKECRPEVGRQAPRRCPPPARTPGYLRHRLVATFRPERGIPSRRNLQRQRRGGITENGIIPRLAPAHPLHAPKFPETTRTDSAQTNDLKTGHIAPGYAGDCLLREKKRHHLAASFKPKSNLLYSTKRNALDAAVCAGRTITRRRKVASEEKIVRDTLRSALNLMEKSSI